MSIFTLLDKVAGAWLDFRSEQRIKNDPILNKMFLEKASISNTDMEIAMVSPAIAVMADEAATMLNANNAKNYVQFDMLPRVDRGLSAIRVTVQWANGEAPAEKAARLEKDVEKLTGILSGDPDLTATKEQREMWRASAIRYTAKLEKVITEMIEYRRRNVLNFQLEKLDYWLEQFTVIMKLPSIHKSTGKVDDDGM